MQLRFLCPRSAADKHGYKLTDPDAWIEPKHPDDSVWHAPLTFLDVELTAIQYMQDGYAYLLDMGNFANGLSIRSKDAAALEAIVRGHHNGALVDVDTAAHPLAAGELFTARVVYDSPHISVTWNGSEKPPYWTPVDEIGRRSATPAVGRATEPKWAAWGGDKRAAAMILVKLAIRTADGLVLDWRLSEGAGTAIQDHSGSGNFGITHGGTWKWV